MGISVQENQSLKSLNSFGIAVKARYLAKVDSIEQLQELINSALFKSNPWMILGGGSNILFCTDFPGLIIKNNIKGISIQNESDDAVYLLANSGEEWHELVLFCIENNFAGIENLSLIPGSVGAAPIQNIGAYGVELKDVLEEVHALNIESNTIEVFNRDDCQFGYRESIFKQAHKGKYIIVAILLKLSKNPVVNISYGAIKQELEKQGITNASIKNVSDTVTAIRLSKLPNPSVLGNAGSFFKNPEISKQAFDQLKSDYPAAPHYLMADSKYKIPAAWLIEQCGWKGKVLGHTGAHKDQALVLVNYGGATGDEIYDLALKIQQSVLAKFNISIQLEVNIYHA